MSGKHPFDTQEGTKLITCTADERAEMIDATQWAAEFSWKQLQALAKFMRAYEVEQGVLLFKEGECSAQMCLVLKGSVCVVKKDSNQDFKRLALLGVGKTFGEMALIDAQPRSASVVANEKSVVLAFSEQDFDDLAEESPHLALALLKKISQMMSTRLRKTTGALSEYLEGLEEQ